MAKNLYLNKYHKEISMLLKVLIFDLEEFLKEILKEKNT